MHDKISGYTFVGNIPVGRNLGLPSLNCVTSSTAYSIDGELLGPEFQALYIKDSDIPAYNRIRDKELARDKRGY